MRSIVRFTAAPCDWEVGTIISTTMGTITSTTMPLGCPIPALFLILPMGFLAKCSKLLKKNSHVFFVFFLTFRGRCLKKTPKKAFFSIFLIFSP